MPSRSRRRSPGQDPTACASTDPGPTLAGDARESATSPSNAGATAAPDAGPSGEPAGGAVATYAGAIPAGWREAPPAHRPHAIRPPRPRGPSVGPGGSSGGVGPTGHWSRFPPAGPPRGDATLHVVVTDQTGARVAGAYVYLGPPASLRAEAVSFGDLRRLGTTDPRGELTAPDLPAGAAVLAANVANQLNGPQGLDARSSIPVLLLSRAVVRAEVVLPLDTTAFGRLEGRVVDEQQRPMARAEIRCGFFQTWTDGEGRFEAPHLPSGPADPERPTQRLCNREPGRGRPAGRDPQRRDRPGLGGERQPRPRGPGPHGGRRRPPRRDALPDRRRRCAARSAPSPRVRRVGTSSRISPSGCGPRRCASRPESTATATPPRPSSWRKV